MSEPWTPSAGSVEGESTPGGPARVAGPVYILFVVTPPHRSVGRGARSAKTIGTAVERQAAEPESSIAHISCRDAPERAVCWE